MSAAPQEIEITIHGIPMGSPEDGHATTADLLAHCVSLAAQGHNATLRIQGLVGTVKVPASG